MPNQHAVSVTAVAIPSTAEIVIATMTPFSENQPPGAFSQALSAPSPNPGPQGVVLDANLNMNITAGGLVTMRIRYGSLTGAVITGMPAGGLIVTAPAATAFTASAFALDPTLVEINAVYVLTVTSAGGVGNVAYGVFTAQDATSFE